MDLAELRSRSVGEQLGALVAGVRSPERLIEAIVFESLVRRRVFMTPPPEVQVLSFQDRVLVPMAAKAKREALSRDAVRAVARASVLLEGDAGIFDAVVLPRLVGGLVAAELELTWMALYRGQLWALSARHQMPRSGFCSVDSKAASAFAAGGIHHLHIEGTVEQMVAAVVVPQACEVVRGRLMVPEARYQALTADPWLDIMEMMATR